MITGTVKDWDLDAIGTADIIGDHGIAPRRVGNQVMQRLVHAANIVRGQTRRHRFNARTVASLLRQFSISGLRDPGAIRTEHLGDVYVVIEGGTSEKR